MNENYFTRIYAGLVRRRHDELVCAGVNPDLAAVQHELLRLDSLRLTEREVGNLLAGEPLESGRRGHTQKSEQAASASRRAARASRDAEMEDTPQAHFDAHLAHLAARCAARTLADYHDEQAEFHRGKANPNTDDIAAAGDDTAINADDDAATGANETPVETSRTEPQTLQLIECARALPSLLGDGALPDCICYMPAGIFSICPSSGGRPAPVTILVNKKTAATMERQRAILAAGGNRPYFSIEHSSDLAAFWPTEFFFAARPDATGKIVEAVWVSGEWTKAGREAVEGKNFRSFSPTFYTNNLSSDADNPAEVICNPDAPLNFGALVNESRFWRGHESTLARRAASKNVNTAAAIAAAEARAQRAEAAALESQIRLALSRARIAELESAAEQRKDMEATRAVQAMVASGVIHRDDIFAMHEMKAKFLDDPELIAFVAMKPFNRRRP